MTTGQRTTEIRINKRTMRIGHETYPLGTIARVRTIKLVWKKGAAFAPLKHVFVAVVLAVVLGAIAQASGFADAVGVIVAVAVVRIVYLVGKIVYRLTRRPIYSLAVETAGTQLGVLFSKDRNEIDRIEQAVVDAIEDPPDREIIMYAHNVFSGDQVNGDKYQQSGVGNTLNVS
jgi:hypothetical protein